MSGDAAPAASEFQPTAELRLDDYLPHRLMVASNAVSRLIARAYERFGVSIPQWRLIAWLSEAGSCTAGAVAAVGIIEETAVVRTARTLQRRGLVQHEAGLLELTAAGHELHGQIAPLVLAYEAALLAGLTPGEVTVLKHLLRKVDAAAARLSGEAV